MKLDSFRRIVSRIGAPARAGFIVLLVLVLVLGPGSRPPAGAAPLVDLAEPLAFPGGAAGGDAAWGDYDNDGDLDLLVTGVNAAGQRVTTLFNNNAGALTPVSVGLPQVDSSSVDWGDFDHDGYLDVLLTGKRGIVAGQVTGLAGVYRSVPNADPANPSLRVFELAYALPNIYDGAGRWGDYNNDGRLDVLLTGYTDGGAPLTMILRNTGSGFEPVTVSGMVHLGGGDAAWGDYNNDGYLDFAIMGRQADGAPRTLVYRAARNGRFRDPVELTGVWGGALLFFDLDNDSDLDLLVTGNRGDNAGNIQPATVLYRYDSGSFSPVSTDLPGVWLSSLSAGDYDNDGYTDVLISGITLTDRPARLYRNDGKGGLVDSGAALPAGIGLVVLFGDYDGDLTLDVTLSGIVQGDAATLVYRNNNPPPPANLPPGPPDLLAACWNPLTNRLTLDWAAPSSGGQPLTYNLRVGTKPGKQDISAPESDPLTGFWRLARPGRLYHGTTAILRGLPPDNYVWSVQAVDAALAGGPFSAEGKIRLGTFVAMPDGASIDEDTPAIINVLNNDIKDYAPLKVYKYTNPANGALSLNSDGSITFTPKANWSGVTSFTYYAVNNERYCTPALVTISVQPVNDPPAGIHLSNDSVLSDLPAGTLVGELSAVDPDPGDTHTFSLVPDIYDNHLFQIDDNRLLTAAPLAYTAPGQLTVEVAARDQEGEEITALFTITVIPNTPARIECAENCAGFDPAAGVVRVTMSEDGDPQPFALTLRGVDDNPDETFIWSLIDPPAHGEADVPGAGKEISVQYAPEPDWFSDPAPDSFVVRVEDSQGYSTEITVEVVVEPVNDPPTLDPIPDQAFQPRAGAQQIALSGISPGPANESGQPLSFTVTSDRPDVVSGLRVEYPGSGGSATLHLSIDGYVGPVVVTVTVSDGQPENGTITRSFTINLGDGPRLYLPLLYGP